MTVYILRVVKWIPSSEHRMYNALYAYIVQRTWYCYTLVNTFEAACNTLQISCLWFIPFRKNVNCVFFSTREWQCLYNTYRHGTLYLPTSYFNNVMVARVDVCTVHTHIICFYIKIHDENRLKRCSKDHDCSCFKNWSKFFNYIY